MMASKAPLNEYILNLLSEIASQLREVFFFSIHISEEWLFQVTGFYLKTV